MRVLVRHAKSGLYLGRNGEWVQAAEAHDFRRIEEAGRHAWAQPEADVVLSYDEPKCELALNPVYCVPDLAARPRLAA